MVGNDTRVEYHPHVHLCTEQRLAERGVAYLSRTENDRVFDPDIDGKRTATMSQRQRKLISGGIDEVNKQKTALNKCLKRIPIRRWIGLLGAIVMKDMLSAPTIAASEDANQIVRVVPRTDARVLLRVLKNQRVKARKRSISQTSTATGDKNGVARR